MAVFVKPVTVFILFLFGAGLRDFVAAVVASQSVHRLERMASLRNILQFNFSIINGNLSCSVFKTKHL